MRLHNNIERCISRYIATHYQKVVEIGIGAKIEVARLLREAGIEVVTTDLSPVPVAESQVPVVIDDIFEPRLEIYEGADAIYSIRPGPEMVPPMIAIARRVSADLLVYHLGDEIYGDGGEIIDCGVILHRYYAPTRHQNRVD
ncbi:MAG: UPF0146 family protein [Methanoculleaceae archaeon]